MTRLIDELDTLHDHYVGAVNAALADGDAARAETLADAYDREAIALIAEREQRTHQLPLERPAADSRLRRLIRRFSEIQAA